MGNVSSHVYQPAINLLEQIAGPRPVPLDDKIWQTVLSFTTPASRFDPAEVEVAVRPHLATLVYNNSATLNLQRLLLVVARQLATCTARGGSVADANAVFLARTVLKDLTEQLNAEQLLGFVELPQGLLAAPGGSTAGAAAGEGRAAAATTVPTAAAAAAVPVGAATADLRAELGGELLRSAGGSLLAALCKAALQVLASKPDLRPGNYLLQLEVVHLLLVLCSTQLFTPSARSALGAHPFLDAIMQQADLANPVVEALLTRYIRMPGVPLSLKIYMPTDTRAVLRIVRTAAASMLWLPYQAYTLLIRPRTPSQSHPDSPLGDASLLLLLALIFHAPPLEASYGNPFRQSLQRLQDADDQVDDPEGGTTVGVSGDAAVPYGALFDALGRTLSNERAVLLLYALLHGSSRFHEYCLVRSDLDTLLLPLLELLYSAHQRTANQLYMLLIILLMLSQDSAFAQNVHRITLQSVPFYRERSMMRTSLGSLLVVLLLRTAHYNLAKLRDVYLHTNTLAALANLAPHMSGLSSHAAQRLVSLFHLLARRYNKLQAAAEGVPIAETPRDSNGVPGGLYSDLSMVSLPTPMASLPTPISPSPQPSLDTLAGEDSAATAAAAAAVAAVAAGQQQELELQLFADFLRIVLEIINAILTNTLPQNPELVYTLLHRAEVFAPFRDHPRYAELMENIQVVTDFFNRKVEEGLKAQGAGGGETSAELVLAIVKQHSRGWRRDKLRPFPELRFTYEEEANPEEFFVPYVWSLVVAYPAIPWNLAAIQLFTPSVIPASVPEEEPGLSPSTTAAHSVDRVPSLDPLRIHTDASAV